MLDVELENGKPSSIKLSSLQLEYHVKFLELLEKDENEQKSPNDSASSSSFIKIPVILTDCVLGLSPLHLPSHACLLINSGMGVLKLEKTFGVKINIEKSSLLMIDDKQSLLPVNEQRRRSKHDLALQYISQGYVSVAIISRIQMALKIENSAINVGVEIGSIYMKSCADSTHSLIQIINDLKPTAEPAPADLKYRTSLPEPVNLLEGIENLGLSDEDDSVLEEIVHPTPLEFVESYYGGGAKSTSSVNTDYSNTDLLLEEDLSVVVARNSSQIGDDEDDDSDVFIDSVQNEPTVRFLDTELNFEENHFENNTEEPSIKTKSAPIIVDFNVIEFTWDLHDGYDWKYTRDTITKAVSRVEYEAEEIRKIQDEEEDLYRNAIDTEEEGEDLVADVLFNSIYISMSTHQDSNQLRHMINKDINDEDDDTSVISMEAETPVNYNKILKLKRSKQHKVKIHLSKIHGTMSIFSSINEESDNPILNKLDIKVTDAEISDNVTTSTWNMFLTYMRSQGEREDGASMFHIIMENVKPVKDIATSEIVLNVFVLPLRLHVDQDTVDFITRFFEFQDDRFDCLMANLQDEIPFIQKADIRAVKVKLDYKPKKVDYAGLRSGHTTEFMNFFILDEAEIVLNHVKLYGISGFPQLSEKLNSIWMPDVRSNQLGDVLAGLAPVRSIVRLGSGIKDLVVVPVREYQKDGRVVRSLKKGAVQFAKNTTSELIKFGAKLAAGTQTILESAVPPPEVTPTGSDETPTKLSLYANQPLTISQGISSAYTSLNRNLGLARDAMGSVSSAKDMVKAAPVVVIRPMIGATEAVTRALLGVTNQIEPDRVKMVQEKYKSGR